MLNKQKRSETRDFNMNESRLAHSTISGPIQIFRSHVFPCAYSVRLDLENQAIAKQIWKVFDVCKSAQMIRRCFFSRFFLLILFRRYDLTDAYSTAVLIPCCANNESPSIKASFVGGICPLFSINDPVGLHLAP
jgi:hypothetical protein